MYLILEKTDLKKSSENIDEVLKCFLKDAQIE